MLSETAARSGFNQNRKPAKASKVRILLTGVDMAMPTKLDGTTSSFTMALTTVPGWVLRKKLRGRVMMWA
jgi:hypothetical protein